MIFLNSTNQVVGVAARAAVEPGRDSESLRGRMGAPQSTRGVEGLFESLLAEAFS
jgi:hypothetical protein